MRSALDGPAAASVSGRDVGGVVGFYVLVVFEGSVQAPVTDATCEIMNSAAE